MTQQLDDEPGTLTAPKRGVPAWAGLLVGVVAAFVGLLPWAVTGLRLPIQNLWATETSDQLPRVLLPFSQYAITLIIGVLVTGSAAGGLGARAAGRRLPRHGVAAILAGVLAVQVVALVQTSVTVRAGLREGRESSIYLAALVGVATLSALVGALALELVARAPRGGAVVGLSIGALALGPWLSGLVVPLGTVSPPPTAVGLLAALGWVPALLVGAAIGWGGVRTVGRALAAVCGLGLLWLVRGLTTAIASSAGSRVLAHDQREMARYAAEVFLAASTTPALVLPPLVVALLAAVVVRVVVRLRGRSTSTPT